MKNFCWATTNFILSTPLQPFLRLPEYLANSHRLCELAPTGDEVLLTVLQFVVDKGISYATNTKAFNSLDSESIKLR